MRILVPYDFTSITRTALEHAMQIAELTDGNITLLHIIKSEKDRDKAQADFKSLINELTTNIAIETQVKVGDIFSDINGEAQNLNSQLIVMGTHGAKGLQKLFGSYAMRVISNSKVPYIVTQESEPRPEIKNIVLPIDLTKESTQIVRFAIILADTFQSCIHLTGELQKDEWLANKVRNNINLSKLALKKAGVNHKIKLLEGKESFQNKIVAYGKACKADFFAVTHFSESILPQFEKFSQDIITNKLQIPTLIVNGNQVSQANSQYSFITT